MRYEEIENRTMPQIEAVLSHLGKHISLKVGMPNIFGGGGDVDTSEPPTDKPPKLSEIMSFCNEFQGLKGGR